MMIHERVSKLLGRKLQPSEADSCATTWRQAFEAALTGILSSPKLTDGHATLRIDLPVNLAIKAADEAVRQLAKGIV